LLEDKKIITAPDVDYSRSFKIMLIDFEWEEITAITEAIKKIDAPITVFLYGSNDKNPSWCISQAKNCNSVLLNMLHRGNCETLKGFLIGECNVYTYGSYDLENLFQRKVLDSMSWLANSYQNFHKQHDENQSK
jgi:hypothetical protein